MTANNPNFFHRFVGERSVSFVIKIFDVYLLSMIGIIYFRLLVCYFSTLSIDILNHIRIFLFSLLPIIVLTSSPFLVNLS